jgi:hypothetical protein
MGGDGVGVGRSEDSKDKDTIKKGYNAAIVRTRISMNEPL